MHSPDGCLCSWCGLPAGLLCLLQTPVSTQKMGTPFLSGHLLVPPFVQHVSVTDISASLVQNLPTPGPPGQMLRPNSRVTPDSLYQNPTSHEAPRLPGTTRHSCSVSSSHGGSWSSQACRAWGGVPAGVSAVSRAIPPQPLLFGGLSLGQPGLAPTPDQKTTGTSLSCIGPCRQTVGRAWCGGRCPQSSGAQVCPASQGLYLPGSTPRNGVFL